MRSLVAANEEKVRGHETLDRGRVESVPWGGAAAQPWCGAAAQPWCCCAAEPLWALQLSSSGSPQATAHQPFID